MTIGVQVNGKLRGTLDVSTEIAEDALKAEAMALEGVVRALDGKTPKRVIVVPRRIVNIVA
jgi:leucyl-tRNA synthetase